MVNFVIVEDEEALQNGNVLLNFVDSQGQVVRQKRTTFDEAQTIGGMALDGAWDDMDTWAVRHGGGAIPGRRRAWPSIRCWLG